jgi:signal transduction histidine kinase
MTKILSVFFCFFFVNVGFSQKNNYLDSLSRTINDLPKREQINIILSQPFDKIVSDSKTYEMLVNKAIQYSKDLKDTLLLADSYASKTYVSGGEENVQLALTAIRLYEHLNQPKKVAGMYTSLGWQLKYRDFDKAFEYYQKGLNILDKLEDKTKIDPVYDNYGVLQGMKKNWDSAMYYHKKSLKIKKQLNDSLGIPFGYSHLANVYLNQGKYDRALKYLDSALVIRQKRQDVYGITDSYLYYGDLYFMKGDYLNAISYFQKGYILALNQNYFPLKKYAVEYLYKSNDSLNNFEEALKYNLIFNTLKDSMLNIETNGKISELEIQYQTENKEKQILSQRAEIAEKELDLSQKNYFILGLVALALVLSLLGFLIYSQQKLKNRQLQKENELKNALIKIETQNRLQEQRLRISRDLHDNIGAQLTFIISSLDNLKYGFKLPENLSSKLKTISDFTTTTIYELRDTIWAMNKSEVSMEDLQTRISNFIEKANATTETVNFQLEIDDNFSNDLKFSSVGGMNIYRIIQEAINNALKYAEANEIKVQFNSSNNSVAITILDNGKGFDENDVEFGNGINNMKKRAQELGAQISISSELQEGTTITLKVPINKRYDI